MIMLCYHKFMFHNCESLGKSWNCGKLGNCEILLNCTILLWYCVLNCTLNIRWYSLDENTFWCDVFFIYLQQEIKLQTFYKLFCWVRNYLFSSCSGEIRLLQWDLFYPVQDNIHLWQLYSELFVTYHGHQLLTEGFLIVHLRQNSSYDSITDWVVNKNHYEMDVIPFAAECVLVCSDRSTFSLWRRKLPCPIWKLLCICNSESILRFVPCVK